MLLREEMLNQLKRRINHGTTSSIRNQIFNSALSRRKEEKNTAVSKKVVLSTLITKILNS